MNTGRDALVFRATGKTKYLNNQYSTTSDFVDGLLKPGFEGLSWHPWRVSMLTSDIQRYDIIRRQP